MYVSTQARAEGKLKDVLQSVLGQFYKTKRAGGEPVTQIFYHNGVLITDPLETHSILTEVFREWYQDGRGRPIRGIETRDWASILGSRDSFFAAYAATNIPLHLLEIVWGAITDIPNRPEVSARLEVEFKTPPSYERFIAAVESLKKGTAPGPSEISYVAIQAYPEEVLRQGYDILSEMWLQDQYPDEWQVRWLMPIPKKVSEEHGIADSSAIRPIMLLETFRKLWEGLIIKQISHTWEGGMFCPMLPTGGE